MPQDERTKRKRTPEEWQELIRALRKITDNPKEPRTRKRKAQDILDSIYKNVGPLSYTEAMRRKEGTHRTTVGTPRTDDDRWEGIV
jgi:hypothetical protein